MWFLIRVGGGLRASKTQNPKVSPKTKRCQEGIFSDKIDPKKFNNFSDFAQKFFKILRYDLKTPINRCEIYSFNKVE